MQETKISVINENNEKLAGLETVPSVEKEKYPTVLLVHGFGVTKHEGGMFDEFSAHLASAGFLVYRFDFSGRGESEGDYSETSISKQKSELSRILEFVKSQEKVDTSRIGILAQSFGTPITVALAPNIQAIVLMGSIAHPDAVSGAPHKWKVLDKDGVSERVKSSGESIFIKPQFWKDMKNYDLLKSVRAIHCPILFIHGSLDEKVPLSEMEAYFAHANEPKEKVILEGANHALRPHREKMYQTVVAWFMKYLS